MAHSPHPVAVRPRLALIGAAALAASLGACSSKPQSRVLIRFDPAATPAAYSAQPGCAAVCAGDTLGYALFLPAANARAAAARQRLATVPAQ